MPTTTKRKRKIQQLQSDEITNDIISAFKFLLKRNISTAKIRFLMPLETKPQAWDKVAASIYSLIIQPLKALNLEFDNPQQQKYFITNLPRYLFSKLDYVDSKIEGIILTNVCYIYNFSDLTKLPMDTITHNFLALSKSKYPCQEKSQESKDPAHKIDISKSVAKPELLLHTPKELRLDDAAMTLHIEDIGSKPAKALPPR